MPPDLTDDDKAALIELLREMLGADRFPLSPRMGRASRCAKAPTVIDQAVTASMLPSVVTALISAFTAAVLTTWFSLWRFRKERWWDKNSTRTCPSWKLFTTW